MELGTNYTTRGRGISIMCAVEYALHSIWLSDEERLLVIDEVSESLPEIDDYYLNKISYKIVRSFLKDNVPLGMTAGVRSAWKDLDNEIGEIIRRRANKNSI